MIPSVTSTIRYLTVSGCIILWRCTGCLIQGLWWIDRDFEKEKNCFSPFFIAAFLSPLFSRKIKLKSYDPEYTAPQHSILYILCFRNYSSFSYDYSAKQYFRERPFPFGSTFPSSISSESNTLVLAPLSSMY